MVMPKNCFQTLSALEPAFNDKEVGSVERLVHAAWELKMIRFFIFESEQLQKKKNEIDSVNRELGAEVIYIDLKMFTTNYRGDLFLNRILEQSTIVKWIWFYNVEALTDMRFAGWLRSLLTVRLIGNIRCVFIVENESIQHQVFGNYRAPFFDSVIPLP